MKSRDILKASLSFSILQQQLFRKKEGNWRQMQIGEKKNDNYTQPKILVLIMQAYRGLHLPAHKNTEMSDRFKRRKKKNHHQMKLYLYASVYIPSNKSLLWVVQACLFNPLILEPTNTISLNLPIMIKLSLSPFQQNIWIPHVQIQHIFKGNIHIELKRIVHDTLWGEKRWSMF